MKKIFFILLACTTLSAAAQQLSTDPAPVKRDSFSLPPLLDLVDSAIKHNADVKYRRYEIELRETNLKSEKIYWTRNLGLQADTRYGTFDNFSSSSTTQSTTLLTSTNRQFNYGVGAYIKLPLGDMLNRKNQVKRAATEVEEAKQLAAAQEDEIRQAVIKLYQDVLLRQKLLKIKSVALGNARVNAEMVEKEFRNGVIPVAEYVRISDIVSRAEGEYEVEKKEFATAKLLLENITGVQLTGKTAAR
ncbi:MAG: TolC family protein [Ferruginibacter sp.]